MGTTCDLLLGLPLLPHTPVVQDTAEANAQRQWQQAQLQFARSRLRNAVGGVENREEFLLKFVDNNGSYGSGPAGRTPPTERVKDQGNRGGRSGVGRLHNQKKRNATPAL